MGHGGLPRVAGRNSCEAAAWRLGLAGKTARLPAARACAGRARGVVTAHRPHVGRRGGAFTSGLAVARRWQGVAGDLEGTTGVVPGKEERARVHRNGMPTVRRRKWCQEVAFNGGGIAPVVIDECGEVLQLERDLGVRRRQSIEGWSSSEGRSPERA
jgi:hypothetical protein